MQTLSYSSLRVHWAKIVSGITMNHAPVVIHDGETEPVVIMSLSDFEAYEETAYLLKSPSNRKRLQESVDEIESLIRARQQDDA